MSEIAPPEEEPRHGDLPPEEDGQFADDQTLSPEFVRSVEDAIDAEDVEAYHGLTREIHPADVADLIGLLREEERDALIAMLGGAIPSEVLAELDEDLREDVIEAMEPAKVAEAVMELDTDDAAFVLEDLDEEKQAEILALAPIEDRLALRAALDFEEDSAGRLMQREFFASPAFWTVGQIIDRLRGTEDLPDKFYEVFVVDPAFKPMGSVPLSTLLKSKRETVIQDIMSSRDMRTVPATMDQEEVAYLFEQYNLISAPVVDDADRLIGMVTVDDVVETVREETQEDMLALAGVEADTGLSDTVFETVRSRFSWLAVNLGTAILASLVIAMFDAAIGQIVALAVLMPIVASMGGNAGTQTLTVVVRSLATKDLTATNAARIVFREALVGFLNGLIFAVIMGALAGVWFFASGWGTEAAAINLALVVGVAMIINLLAAGLAGILIPIGLQRAGADPAVSSAVFVTTVTDIVGFFVFLGLAAAVLLPAAG
ncbi:magnesium transporter [Hyphococcus flavus]|uniref:Magnesium transporter MgtE n=1 Tax=Hyphococcus flavus TaxID=1866326 RepID=A0AAE9ZDU1_9PROT|nr:magnesium transporter [Hyphococcus flavus]WDI31790.1 magnesium transporter [Hyphococcus flavus]